MGAVGIAVRRSIAGGGLLALAVVVALHVLGRERPWTHEWLWALYQYQFVTVLLGPLAAGMGAWEGIRLARAGDLVGSSGQRCAPLWVAVAAVASWVAVAYFAGLALVVALVKASGTPGWPSAVDWLTVLPPITLIGAEVTLGLAAGWRFPSLVTPPVIAITCFVGVLFCYVTGPGPLAEVGGASASLVGLRPRPELQLAQVLWFSAVGTAAIAIASRRREWAHGTRRVARPLHALAAGLALLLILAQGEEVFERNDDAVICRGQQPRLCVGPGYVKAAARARDVLEKPISALRVAGVATPEAFDQRARPESGAAELPAQLLLAPDLDAAEATVLSWYIPGGCDVSRSAPGVDALSGLSWWLRDLRGAARSDPTLPSTLTAGSRETRLAWVRDAVDTLRRCGR